MLLVAAVSAGCTRRGGEAGTSGAPVVEIRDADGQPTLSVRRIDGGLRWLDLAGHTQGDLFAKDGRIVTTRGGQEGEALTADKEAVDALAIRRPGGHRLLLARVGGALRLGDGAGIPVARIRAEGDNGAVAYDAGGLIVASARSAGGRIVLSDSAGHTTGFVTGSASVERAALIMLGMLLPAERAILLAY